MFEPDLGPMPDDDDDELNDELNDIGLLTREAPAAKTTKAKSAPREKPAPKSSAWELTGNAELDALFQSCLLYTSPSPRDRQKSRMPSSA